ncbi:Transcriptional regulator [Cupriavidus taiwanensis]|nr:Transcriptional regulator [Cupriavidus taiwanensis]
MRGMDLNTVRMFVAAVQAGSLSAAAQRLNMPLPTLSRRIRALEQQLSVQLLERSVQGIRLTEAGARLYEHASRGLEILAEAEEAVVSDQEHLKGRLRLSLPTTFQPWWNLLAEFQQCYPDIQIHVHATERRVDLIEDGIDVALRVGAVVHESMVARRLLSYRHVLVASPQLIDRLGVPVSPADLDRFPCATWASRIDEPARWRLGSDWVDPRPVLSTNDYHHLCLRAMAGDVIVELPPFLASAPIRQGDLVPLLPMYPLPELPVSLIFPSHRFPSTLVRSYVNFCEQYRPRLALACEIVPA